MIKTLLVGFIFGLTACQSAPGGHVVVGSGYPLGKNCEEIGQVIGNAHTRERARSQAIEDLKFNASRLEADYVRLMAVSAHGTAARGIAYRCQ